MTGPRWRLLAVFVGLLGSATVMLAWTQTWFSVVLTTGFRLDVPGSAAAGALTALALAGLALCGALTIAGPVMRRVLGAIEVLLGGGSVAIAVAGLSDPVAAASGTISDATAVAGRASITELILALNATPFPVVGIVGGAILALGGLLVLVTASRWPRGSRKYEADRDRSTSAAGTWDALTGGDDPTR